MQKIERVSKSLLRELMQLEPDTEDRDDMAIPSYLHRNPLINWLFWKRLDVVHSELSRSHYGTILDYGCGTGTFLKALGDKSERVIGCDKRPQIARAMVQRLGLKNATIVDVDGFNNIPPESLDAIVSADVLEHVEDLDKLVKAFQQCLKPGGQLVISGPTENALYKLGRSIAGFSGDYHVRNIADIDRTILGNGFRKIRTRTLPVPATPAALSLFHIHHYTR